MCVCVIKKSRTKATGMKHRKPIERINANIAARLRIHVPAHTPMWDAPISLRVRLERRHMCVFLENGEGGGSVKAGIIMRTHETTTRTAPSLPCSSHNYEGNNFYLLGACFRQNEIERKRERQMKVVLPSFCEGFLFFLAFPFR